MESKKDKTVKVKSSLAQARKIIAEKFNKLHMNNVLTERKLREKYAPLTDSLQRLIESKEEKNRQQNESNHEQQQQPQQEEEMNLDVDDEGGDVFDIPPPSYPPPPLPPPRYKRDRRHQRQNVGPVPPIPPRSRSRSPNSPPPSQYRRISRRSSLPQVVAPLSKKKSKRLHPVTSSDSESDVFGLNRYKSEPKLRRKSFEPIDYDGDDDVEHDKKTQ